MAALLWPFINAFAIGDQEIARECSELNLNDSLSCYTYMDCRKEGLSKNQCNKSGGAYQAEKRSSKSVATEIGSQVKRDEDLKNKAEQEYQRRMVEEYQLQQQRCYSGKPAPGCPNYHPVYDKKGR